MPIASVVSWSSGLNRSHCDWLLDQVLPLAIVFSRGSGFGHFVIVTGGVSGFTPFAIVIGGGSGFTPLAIAFR